MTEVGQEREAGGGGGVGSRHPAPGQAGFRVEGQRSEVLGGATLYCAMLAELASSERLIGISVSHLSPVSLTKLDINILNKLFHHSMESKHHHVLIPTLT